MGQPRLLTLDINKRDYAHVQHQLRRHAPIVMHVLHASTLANEPHMGVVVVGDIWCCASFDTTPVVDAYAEHEARPRAADGNTQTVTRVGGVEVSVRILGLLTKEEQVAAAARVARINDAP
jgi:hypothetical protein